jgi:ornithine cyclodeaminase/alanine dehydrogenase-like protein (mu-crystallin family)
MLFLSSAQIRRCLPTEVAMSAVQSALAIQESGDFIMPERLNMNCGAGDNKLLLMPCKTDQALACKLVSVFPTNPSLGRPAIDGLMVLNDPHTAEVLAVMDGKSITALRTGAVTGLSVRYLAPEAAHTLGLIGCGAMAFDQVRHVCAVRSIKTVLLYSRSEASCLALREKLAVELPDVEVTVAASIEFLMKACQVLVTATTAREPVLPDDPQLYEGTHCVAIGSFEPSVREYPDAIFQRTAKVWVDTPHAMVESGELAIPLQNGTLKTEQIQSLGALIAAECSPDRGEFGTTFFKSVGMALFDLQIALEVYHAARRDGLGTEFEF